MKTLRSLYLWVRGSIVFGFFAILLILLCKLKIRKPVEFLSRIASQTILWAIGLTLQVKGTEHIKNDKGYILMGNHVNLFDPFIIKAAFPHPFKVVELDTHFNWPIYGTLVKALGHIPISHKDRQSAIKTIEGLKEQLKTGNHVMLLPEGHRTKDGRLGEFKKGGFILAKECNHDILPFSFTGAFEIFNKTSWHITPGVVSLNFLPPVSPLDFNDSDSLLEHIKRIIASGLKTD